MSKLNISMPQELLEQIHAEAELDRPGARDAARRMKEIGAKMGLTSIDAVALLAEARAAEEPRLNL